MTDLDPVGSRAVSSRHSPVEVRTVRSDRRTEPAPPSAELPHITSFAPWRCCRYATAKSSTARAGIDITAHLRDRGVLKDGMPRGRVVRSGAGPAARSGRPGDVDGAGGHGPFFGSEAIR